MKNNQTFYRSSSSQLKDNESESGDTCLTSVSHPDVLRTNPGPSECKSTGQESVCEDKSDLESIAKSDFERDSICVRSDIDYAKSECSSINRFRESSSSCLADEESNTTGSGVFVPTNSNAAESGLFITDSVVSGPDTNISSSILVRQDSNHSKDSALSSCNEPSSKDPDSKPQSNTVDATSVNTETKGSCTIGKDVHTGDTNTKDSSTLDSYNSRETDGLEDSSSVLSDKSNLVDTSNTSLTDKTDSSVPAPPLFTLTDSLVKKAKSCKVFLNSIPNERRMIEDLASMYDDETRF